MYFYFLITRIDAWIIKGNALHMLGRYEDAIKCYDRLIKIDPTHDDVV